MKDDTYNVMKLYRKLLILEMSTIILKKKAKQLT